MNNDELTEGIDLNSIPVKDIFQLSFELFNNVLIIDFHKARVIDGVNTKRIKIKSTYDKFQVKLFELNRYKGLI